MDSLLKLVKVNKNFEKITILNNISLNVAGGEFVHIAGGNGAGKSTLFQLILGFLKVDGGQMLWENDQDITKSSTPDRVRNGISYMPQTSCLINTITVEKNIEYAKESLGENLLLKNPDIDNELAHLFDWQKFSDRYVYSLSRGERKKLELYITILYDAHLYIFDEPVSGLDQTSLEYTYQIIHKLNKAGKAVIFCDHNLDERLLTHVHSHYTLAGGTLKADE